MSAPAALKTHSSPANNLIVYEDVKPNSTKFVESVFFSHTQPRVPISVDCTSISSDVIDALSAKGLSVVNHQAVVIYFAKNIGRGRSITIGYVDATDEQNVMKAAKRFIKLSK